MQEMELLKQRLLQAVDEHQEELLGLVSSLIQIPSENPPKDSTDVTHFVYNYLKKNDIEMEIHEASPKMYNLVGKIGSPEGKKLIYCGHTDVVPAGDLSKWDFPPFSGEIVDGWMLGRGASDMKAGLGGIMFAAVLLKRLNVELPGELVLAIVPDEETGGEDGVPWLLENNLIHGDGSMIAEPSSPNHPTLAQKGSCWFKLTVTGVPGHGSLSPLEGVNAITDAIRAIAEIRKVYELEIEPPEEVKEILRVSNDYMRLHEREKYEGILEKISCNIGTIHGGTKSNVVPDSCTVEVDCRLPFGITQNEVYALIENKLDEMGIIYQIEPFGFRSNANFTSPNDPVCRAIVDNITYVTNEEAYGVMQWASSDARHFRDYNIPVLQYGPAYLPSIHGYNEKVKTEDIIRCAKVYLLAAIDFLNEPAS
ncbi:M20 family metallopeptidase [Aureibacillus halotolerans]|uniref:Probable succinyl-diaminopimelate desuccinylase n=1 Tax=Aureibacillus halotolerans TaxID=1508390 RepID=A0A4R6TTC3_9BACI|nr:ArgE/DapE family deacylase [Aureibacillus halotolerans]TDQ36541.1 succinyl-diaminopimelate desuccinylase [Aureibacillus halotolerans]